MDKFAICYPASIDLLVYIINESTQQVGTVTISFKPGVEVTKDTIRSRIAEFEREQMPEGFRLLSKRETWDMMCDELAGEGARFAMPGGPDFDK